MVGEIELNSDSKTIVEYRRRDSANRLLRFRLWPKLCAIAGLVSLGGWIVSATFPGWHSVSVDFGVQTTGVGIDNGTIRWYWKDHDYFTHDVQLQLWLLVAFFAIIFALLLFLRRLWRD